jgi:hypothetical protein
MHTNKVYEFPRMAELQRRTGGTALLVASDRFLVDDLSFVLQTSHDYVQSALTSIEVFRLSKDYNPRTVVLCGTLGAFHLQAVAEYARRRWPRARIIVIGKAWELLADELYDASVATDFTLPELQSTVEKCRTHE